MPFVLVVNPSLGVNSVKELVALAKSKPGELAYASAGVGAVHHIFCELFMSMTGIKMRHVPYRGGALAQNDVVAGHVPVYFADAGPAAALIKSGQLKALGVTTATRSSNLPDVPTLDEAGVTGYEANTWQMMVGPPQHAGADREEAQPRRWPMSCVTPEAQNYFTSLGMQPSTSTPEEAHEHIVKEAARWTAGHQRHRHQRRVGVDFAQPRRKPSMSKQLTIGLVVPFSTDKVPEEGPMMYPGVKFIPRAVGVRALTPEGYDAAWNAILPAAKQLAKEGVDAIMVIGTSLTFYRGYDAHQQLLEQLRKETGLPVSTMTEAVVDGLKPLAQSASRSPPPMPTRSTIGSPISSAGRASMCWRSRASACSASASRARSPSRTSSISAARRSRRRASPTRC